MAASRRASVTDDRAEQRLLGAANAGLACIGLYVGAVGPALETIADHLDVSLDTAGLTLTAMAAGAVVAAGAVAARFHHGSQRNVAAIGIAAMTLGLVGWAVAPTWIVFILCGLLVGAGGGLADAGGHGLATSAERGDVAVSKLNQAFAAGAVVGPAWTGVVLQLGGELWMVFGGLAAVTAAVSGLIATAPERPRRGAIHQHGETRPRVKVPMVAVAMSAVLFLYVGAEIGLGAWTSAATERAADTTILAGAMVTSGYWGALWAGRAASGVALERGWRSERILAGSIVGAGMGSVALAIGGESLVIGAVGAAVTGFCFGPVWPSAVALGTRSAPPNTAAMMVTLGNGGGIVLPWVQGRVLVEQGPRAGMGMSAGLCAGMLLLALSTFPRRERRAPAFEPE
jgi:fucose permease